MSLTPSLGTIHSNIPLKIKFAVQISNAILHAAVGKKQTHDWVLLQGIWITSTPIKPLLAANSDPVPLDQPFAEPAVDVPEEPPLEGPAAAVLGQPSCG